jgi:hypothetical protein
MGAKGEIPVGAAVVVVFVKDHVMKLAVQLQYEEKDLQNRGQTSYLRKLCTDLFSDRSGCICSSICLFLTDKLKQYYRYLLLLYS